MLYPDEVKSPSLSWAQLEAPLPAAKIVFFELKNPGAEMLVSMLEPKRTPDPAPVTALLAMVDPVAKPVGGEPPTQTSMIPPPVALPSPPWAAVAVALFPVTVERLRFNWLLPLCM